MFGEKDGESPEEYAREAYRSFKEEEESEVRKELILGYADEFYERHGTWPKEEDFVQHIRELHDHLDHHESRMEVEAEKLLWKGQESKPVCLGCLKLMDYKGWLVTGMSEWENGRPYMEPEEVKIYPEAPEEFDHVEEEKTVEIEYTCPTGEHNESYHEFHFFSDEELDQVLDSFAADAEKVKDLLGTDD